MDVLIRDASAEIRKAAESEESGSVANSVEPASESKVGYHGADGEFTGRPVRILHLSDLHFGERFDPALWEHVGDVLEGSEKPDVIVVTGDLVDSPSFFMLGIARRELLRRRDHWGTGASCELVVIPGNHDVGILGNVALPPWNKKFEIVFCESPHRIFDKLPGFDQYRSWKRYKRWPIRCWWAMAFAWLKLTRQLRTADRPARLIREVAGRRVWLACFNSNGEMRLASGRVPHASLLAAHGELLGLRLPGPDRKLRNLVPRIALVHHHVIPIPYAGAIEGPTQFEPFLVLRNAGTLLRELCAWDFDMVLHGHKHALNFARLTFDSADDARSQLAVLAAGSATTRQSGAGQNSFNLIKAYPNGCISFRSVRYGQDRSGEIDGAWQGGFRRLLPFEELKRRVHARALGGLQMGSDMYECTYDIDEDGSANVAVNVRGLRGADDERLRSRRQGFGVGFGAIDASSIRLDQESLSAGHQIEGLVEHVPSNRVDFNVVLGSPRMASDEGSSYGVRCRFLNSFAMTPWECEAMRQPCQRDWVSTVVRVPTRALRLSVSLPKTLRDPQPEVVVERFHDYPLLHVDGRGELDLENPMQECWVRDPDLTELEKANLRCIGSHLVLDVEYPMVGHRYKIRWGIRSQSTETTTERTRLAMQLRRSLIEMGESHGGDRAAVARLAREMLGKVLAQILRPMLRSEYAFQDRLAVSLYVFDDEKKHLTLVVNASEPQDGPGLVKTIPLNAGVAGAAFKSRRVKIYVCPECARQTRGGVYIYFPPELPEALRPKFTALMAIPLHLGDILPWASDSQSKADSGVPPEEMIGIFTVSSTAFDSKLIALGEEVPESDEKQEIQETLTDRLWSVAVQYLRGLSEAVRTAVKLH
jgi:hypothetical protein